MAFAYVHEFDVGADRSTTNYDAISDRMRLDDDPAEGLIVHAAGFSGGKFRMIEIWESPELEQRFERERLLPAVQEVVRDGAAPPVTHSYELHNLIAPR
jgi:quinol monooxygenase YgiN